LGAGYDIPAGPVTVIPTVNYNFLGNGVDTWVYGITFGWGF
jgi:hypothetical protein